MVQDPTGSAIPGALVGIKNVGTNLVANVQSGSDGTYFIPQLPVGTYQLTVEAKGFKKYTRDGVTLNLGDKAMVNIRMEIGAATESVTVTAELTGIESNQSVTGQTLASKQLVEVPTAGGTLLTSCRCRQACWARTHLVKTPCRPARTETVGTWISKYSAAARTRICSPWTAPLRD